VLERIRAYGSFDTASPAQGSLAGLGLSRCAAGREFCVTHHLGIERCGKINAVNSVSESWTGISVVAGLAAVLLLTQGPHVKNMDAHRRINLPQILQEVRSICKTRNHLNSS